MAATELFYNNILAKATYYWRLEGNSNGTVGGINGSDTSITYGTSYGRYGQGASLNGSSSRILFGDIGDATTGDTRSVWAYITTFPSTGANLTIMSKGFTMSGDTHGPTIDMDNAGGTTSLRYLVKTLDNYFIASFAIDASYQNKWIHIVGLTKSGYAYLYINGKRVAISSAITNTLSNSSANMTLGCRDYNGTFDRYFTGYLDDPAIFNTALSDWEIYMLAQGHTLGEYIPSSSTKFYMPMNGIVLCYTTV